MAEPNSIEYRPVEGFPGYRVGNDGSVWTCFRGPRMTDGWRRLKPQPHRKGRKYLCVKLWKQGRPHNRLVHRLVLETFVGPRPLGAETRHLDGNPVNNALDNIAWGTHAENTEDTRRLDRFDRKLNAEQVVGIRARHAAGASHKEIAAEFGTSWTNVGSIVQGRSWKHLL